MVAADSGYCCLWEHFECQRSRRTPSFILERVRSHSATGMETRSLAGLQLLTLPTVLPVKKSGPYGRPLKCLPIPYHVPQPDVVDDAVWRRRKAKCPQILSIRRAHQNHLRSKAGTVTGQSCTVGSMTRPGDCKLDAKWPKAELCACVGLQETLAFY